MKLKHVFLSRIYLLYFLHAVHLIPCQGSYGCNPAISPTHVPKTLVNQACISLDNETSNFQIFIKCGPQQTLTTCFSNFPQTFTFWKILWHCFIMIFRRERGEESIANVKPQVVFKRPSSQYQFRIRKITKALTSQCGPFKVRNIIKLLRTSCSVRAPFHFPTLMAVAQTS